jgi:secreted Zn-dependent insulinase-like peptidase
MFLSESHTVRHLNFRVQSPEKGPEFIEERINMFLLSIKNDPNYFSAKNVEQAK